MSKFETTLSNTVSLKSNSFNHQNYSDTNKESQGENRSAKNDIYRYSYNLGRHKVGRIQRTASVGGNLLSPMDGSLAKKLISRRGMTRSMSMGSQIGLKTKSELIEEKNLKGAQVENEFPYKLNQSSLGEKAEQIPGNEMENPPQAESNSIVKDPPISPASTIENEPKKILDQAAKSIPNAFLKKSHGFSDSVPDLRSTGNSENHLSLQEGLSTLLDQNADQPQSRSICKLRRAARRLGVSLSSEELYHKQRRNGVCTEIDDAAENRKLLRVLNKRF